MNTKLIMTASAAALGLAGIIFTFIPGEVLNYLHLETGKVLQFLLQILGALYFAFAMLNWMTRTSIIGGIYNKPITVANFTHFFIGAMALIKWLISGSNLQYGILIVTIIYTVFAILFGFIFMRNPTKENKAV